GMGEVVDAGTSATALWILDIDEDHALDRAQERARLSADPLTVSQVAGVLIDDADRPPGARRDGLHDLADVAHSSREPFGTVRPERVVAEDVAVVFEMRAAARGVHHDLPVATRKGIDVQ